MSIHRRKSLFSLHKTGRKSLPLSSVAKRVHLIGLGAKFDPLAASSVSSVGLFDGFVPAG